MAMSNSLLAFCLLPVVALAQSSLVNADFSEGEPGLQPPGWRLGANKRGYSAHTLADLCNTGPRCAMLRSNTSVTADGLAFLFQVLDAKPYRGKQFRFRAAVRIEVADTSG